MNGDNAASTSTGHQNFSFLILMFDR